MEKKKKRRRRTIRIRRQQQKHICENFMRRNKSTSPRKRKSYALQRFQTMMTIDCRLYDFGSHYTTGDTCASKL
eukprot:1369316-Amphidinium_carterae.2